VIVNLLPLVRVCLPSRSPASRCFRRRQCPDPVRVPEGFQAPFGDSYDYLSGTAILRLS
jgi:hypothetical protein